MQMCLLYCLYVLSFYKRLCTRHNALYGAVQESGGGGSRVASELLWVSSWSALHCLGIDWGEKSREGGWGQKQGELLWAPSGNQRELNWKFENHLREMKL